MRGDDALAKVGAGSVHGGGAGLGGHGVEGLGDNVEVSFKQGGEHVEGVEGAENVKCLEGVNWEELGIGCWVEVGGLPGSRGRRGLRSLLGGLRWGGLVGLVKIKMWVFRRLPGVSAAHVAVLETRRAAIAVNLGKRMVDSVVRSYNPRGIIMGNTYTWYGRERSFILCWRQDV